MRHAGRILPITCDDDASLNWLTKTVNSLKIDDLDLSVIAVTDLPGLTKISLLGLLIAGIPFYLTAQNPEFNIKGWCCKDAALLKSRESKLNYMFTSSSTYTINI